MTPSSRRTAAVAVALAGLRAMLTAHAARDAAPVAAPSRMLIMPFAVVPEPGASGGSVATAAF